LEKSEVKEHGWSVNLQAETPAQPEANVEEFDPWAIVELVDDSKPWSGNETVK